MRGRGRDKQKKIWEGAEIDREVDGAHGSPTGAGFELEYSLSMQFGQVSVGPRFPSFSTASLNSAHSFRADSDGRFDSALAHFCWSPGCRRGRFRMRLRCPVSRMNRMWNGALARIDDDQSITLRDDRIEV